MNRPNLRLTGAAKSALIAMMNDITEFKPIAAVVWSVAGSAGYQLPNGEQKIVDLGPHWGVGFHNSAKIPVDEIVEIDGIPFVFDMSSSSKRLHGARLDYANGDFVVEENAI